MVFETEPTGYIKTSLSELQGSWGNLRNEVVKQFGFPGSDKLLFHIDEAMSWESVRNLNNMKSTLLLVQNISNQADAPDEIKEWVDSVRESFEETVMAIKHGEAE
jgi:hypothetical protein